MWTHEKGGQIRNVLTNDCVTSSGVASTGNLKTEPCDPNDIYQLWWFQTYTDIEVQA